MTMIATANSVDVSSVLIIVLLVLAIIALLIYILRR